MWEKLKHEKRKLRNWDCSVAFDEHGVRIYERGKLKGGFTYPESDNYKEFADKVFKRVQATILDITFHQELWGKNEY